MRPFSLAAGLVVAAVVGFAPPAAALKLTPFVAAFAPHGPAATQLFRVENESNEPAAVQVSMVHRAVDEDGNEKLADAEDDFAVFPPQLVLMPGDIKTVRVQWLGDAAPKSELAYRIIVEQLPIDIGDTGPGARIKLLVRYQGSVYIVPAGAKSDVKVAEASLVKRPEGGAGLALAIANQGEAHAVLAQLKIHLKSGVDGAATTLSGDQLKGLDGENVLAGHRRHLTIPWPSALPQGAVTATLEFQPSLP
jgi:fimbrial chaperone protein